MENKILNMVLVYTGSEFGIRKENILVKSRVKEIIEPRHLTIWVLRNIYYWNLTKIADYTDRDHSTIISSLKTYEALFKFDRLYREKCTRVIQKIQTLKFNVEIHNRSYTWDHEKIIAK